MSIAVKERIVENPAPIILHVPIVEDIVLAADVKIPAGIVDLASFREWAHSDDFPERGRIDYSDGVIWVDLSMEQLYDHNQVRAAIFTVLYVLTAQQKTGRIFDDGVRVSLPDSDQSREPDALFVSFDSFRSDRIREKPGRRHGTTELEGCPDMVLEVLSDFSEEMDADERPVKYYQAGVNELWRVDARSEPCAFEILFRGDEGFETKHVDGWQRSLIFNRWFQLLQHFDERNKPYFELAVKE